MHGFLNSHRNGPRSSGALAARETAWGKRNFACSPEDLDGCAGVQVKIGGWSILSIQEILHGGGNADTSHLLQLQ